MGQSFFHEVDEAYINSFLTRTFTGSRSITNLNTNGRTCYSGAYSRLSGQQGGGLGTVSFLLLYQFHILSIPYPFFLVRSLAPFNPSSQFRAVRRPPVSHGETFSRFEDLSDSLSKIGYVLARTLLFSK